MLHHGGTDQDDEQHHRHHRCPPDCRGPKRLGVDAVGHQVGAALRPTASQRVDGVENLCGADDSGNQDENMVGRNMGRVMRQKRCQALAPSVRAAL